MYVDGILADREHVRFQIADEHVQLQSLVLRLLHVLDRVRDLRVRQELREVRTVQSSADSLLELFFFVINL